MALGPSFKFRGYCLGGNQGWTSGHITYCSLFLSMRGLSSMFYQSSHFLRLAWSCQPPHFVSSSRFVKLWDIARLQHWQRSSSHCSSLFAASLCLATGSSALCHFGMIHRLSPSWILWRIEKRPWRFSTFCIVPDMPSNCSGGTSSLAKCCRSSATLPAPVPVSYQRINKDCRGQEMQVSQKAILAFHPTLHNFRESGQLLVCHLHTHLKNSMNVPHKDVQVNICKMGQT